VAYICSREHTESEDLVVRTPRAFSKIIPRLFDIILEHFDVLHDQLSLGFHKAVQGGYAAVVKLLLEKSAELESKDDRWGQTPLSWAARGGHEAVVQLLLA